MDLLCHCCIFCHQFNSNEKRQQFWKKVFQEMMEGDASWLIGAERFKVRSARTYLLYVHCTIIHSSHKPTEVSSSKFTYLFDSCQSFKPQIISKCLVESKSWADSRQNIPSSSSYTYNIFRDFTNQHYLSSIVEPCRKTVNCFSQLVNYK